MVYGYTTIEQSRKLAEFLPIESADMWYSYYGNSKYNPTIAYKGQQWFLCQIRNSLHDDIPCWSLAALLRILPNENMLVKTTDGEYYCLAKDVMTKHYDNPVDACVDMIEKLHKLKML